MSTYQLFDDLTDEEYQALKASIAQDGVLVPVEMDESGNILDGHHRVRAWNELRHEGVVVGDYPRIIRSGMSEEQKRNHVRKLNLLRRHLSKEQRVEQMRAMRADGAGYEDIAAAAGVGVGTAFRTTRDVELFQMEKLPGADGKSRPPSYQKRERPVSIFANSAYDEKRALEAAAGIMDAPAKVITANRAAQLAREARSVQSRQRHEDIKTEETLLICGDFRERGQELPDASVDLIFTDPPYAEEFLPLWDDLGSFAARVLKPTGMLISYTGAMYLPKIIDMLSEHLTYWWTGAIVLPGAHSRVFARHVAQGSKPLLFYVPNGGGPSAWFGDTYYSEQVEKDARDWQQSIGASLYYIRTLTKLGDCVVDPFLGGGTTGLAAKQTGRRFIGFEIDPAAFAIASDRIVGSQKA